MAEPVKSIEMRTAAPVKNSVEELNAIYKNRFNSHLQYRNEVWKVLISRFFSQFISPDASVMDVGCGYGQFINNVSCRNRFGIDLNPGTREYLDPEVTFIEQDCSAPWPFSDDSFDLVFTSNFFEHLPSKAALGDTISAIHRCLRPAGRIIAMGPNIRFVGGAYWDFWDHHLALTDSSLAEALRTRGFTIERAIDRFLPYTMVNRRPVPPMLVQLYLKVSLLWKIFGKQFLVIARKT